MASAMYCSLTAMRLLRRPCEKYKELQASVATSLYSYYNPATVEYSDKAISLSLLSHGNIFDLTSNTFKRGGLHVLRDAVQEVLSNLDEYTCVIVKGRRFSGKLPFSVI